MQTTGKEKRRQSAISLFSKGFFSGMSFPVLFETKRTETAERRVDYRKRDIGRHFAKVGNMLSDAYDREMEKAGLKK